MRARAVHGHNYGESGESGMSEKKAQEVLRTIDYYDFCVRYQLKEIMEHVAENNPLEKVRNEFVDVLAIAHEAIVALGGDPRAEIERRFQSRYEDKIPEIVEKYSRIFQKYLVELYGHA